MRSYYKFVHTFHSKDTIEPDMRVEYETHSENLNDLLDDFASFLRGAGFSIGELYHERETDRS